jgi:hypothetical protein
VHECDAVRVPSWLRTHCAWQRRCRDDQATELSPFHALAFRGALSLPAAQSLSGGRAGAISVMNVHCRDLSASCIARVDPANLERHKATGHQRLLLAVKQRPANRDD